MKRSKNAIFMVILAAFAMMAMGCEITIHTPEDHQYFWPEEDVHFKADYNGIGDIKWKATVILTPNECGYYPEGTECPVLGELNDAWFSANAVDVGKGYPWEFIIPGFEPSPDVSYDGYIDDHDGRGAIEITAYKGDSEKDVSILVDDECRTDTDCTELLDQCSDGECIHGHCNLWTTPDEPCTGIPCEINTFCDPDGEGCFGDPYICPVGQLCSNIEGGWDGAPFCYSPATACDDGIACTKDIFTDDCHNTPDDLACQDHVRSTWDICDPRVGCLNPDCSGYTEGVCPPHFLNPDNGAVIDCSATSPARTQGFVLVANYHHHRDMDLVFDIYEDGGTEPVFTAYAGDTGTYFDDYAHAGLLRVYCDAYTGTVGTYKLTDGDYRIVARDDNPENWPDVMSEIEITVTGN